MVFSIIDNIGFWNLTSQAIVIKMFHVNVSKCLEIIIIYNANYSY